jgi:hypothetical protein
MTRALLVLLLAAACKREPPPSTPCTDSWHIADKPVKCRSDQTLHYEKDADDDEWIVCRCEKP